MNTLVLDYALLRVFVALERLLRRGAAATSLTAQQTDQGTTRLILLLRAVWGVGKLRC